MTRCLAVAMLTRQSDTYAVAESYDEAAGRYRGRRTASRW